MGSSAFTLSSALTQALAFAAFGGFFMLAGLFMIVLGRRNRRMALASAGWPQTPGIVTSAKVKTVKQKSNESTHYSYRPVIAYEYTVGGTKLTGKRLGFGVAPVPSHADAEALLAPYPVGATVGVYYDPAKPKTATLSTDVSGTRTAGFTGWMLVVCGLGFVGYGVFLALRH